MIELNFTDGKISSLNTKGKVQKSHHASKVMFAEKVSTTMLVLHFPDKKDYKLNFVVRCAPLRLPPASPLPARCCRATVPAPGASLPAERGIARLLCDCGRRLTSELHHPYACACWCRRGAASMIRTGVMRTGGLISVTQSLTDDAVHRRPRIARCSARSL